MDWGVSIKGVSVFVPVELRCLGSDCSVTVTVGRAVGGAGVVACACAAALGGVNTLAMTTAAMGVVRSFRCRKRRRGGGVSSEWLLQWQDPVAAEYIASRRVVKGCLGTGLGGGEMRSDCCPNGRYGVRAVCAQSRGVASIRFQVLPFPLSEST